MCLLNSWTSAKDYNKCLDYIHAVKEQYIEYQILKSACLIHLGGKILEAHAILDEILVKEPNNAYTIYAKGLALFHEEKYEEAITYFTQARKLDQTSDMIRAEIMTEKAHAKIKERQEKSSRPKAVPSRFKIAAPVKPPVVFRTPTTNNKPVYSPPSSDKTDRRFGCEICNHFFAKKFNLDRHNRSLHKRTTPDNFPTSPRDIKLKSKSSLVPRIKAEPVFKKEPVVKSAIKPEPKQAAAIVVEPKSATKAVSKKSTSPVKSALKKFPSKIDVSLLPVKNGKVKCPECRRFFRKTSISRHILIHTGNKGHKCDQCTMAFYQKSDLSRHVVNCAKNLISSPAAT